MSTESNTEEYRWCKRRCEACHCLVLISLPSLKVIVCVLRYSSALKGTLTLRYLNPEVVDIVKFPLQHKRLHDCALMKLNIKMSDREVWAMEDVFFGIISVVSSVMYDCLFC